MPSTMSERKQAYYKIVSKKASALYSSWGYKRGISKKLVKKANEYAFDKRLKTDIAYRFSVIVFVYALSLRLEKYYRSFLRKLFHIFAFLRERNALKMLKRVLGFYNHTDIRELIEVEMEKLSVIISKRTNQDTTGGGKHSEMGELSMEEEVERFFKTVEKENAQNTAENHLTSDKTDALNAQDETTSVQSTETKREKISVNETLDDKSREQEKDTLSIETKKQDLSKNAPEQAKVFEGKMEETSTQKSAANTSILAETLILEQESEQTHASPFPVFRETDAGQSFTGKKEDFVVNTAKEEISATNEKGESVGDNPCSEIEQKKDIFPVFSMDKETVKPIVGRMEISEENKARIELNTTMTKEQIEAIATQMQEAAKVIMEQEERVWREQISVADNQHTEQSQSKAVQSSQNNETSMQGPKK